ncbi:Aste57867_3036 [Aphanomyces stellatus]|uniref:Phosphodiesterase n=1 Tax=Aphanomyces stellatus TaxID=120398 RepID=A0A485KBC3_9STRA|nr:hypothetical protein As57867_003027 [Aphanomyces stellatus]VFT80216.1 Aste57867_3036 [Aphanomyces stellatus]
MHRCRPAWVQGTVVSNIGFAVDLYLGRGGEHGRLRALSSSGWWFRAGRQQECTHAAEAAAAGRTASSTTTPGSLSAGDITCEEIPDDQVDDTTMNVNVKSPRVSAKPGARSVVPSDSLPVRKSVIDLPPNARQRLRARHPVVKFMDKPRAKVGAFVMHIKVELFFISIVICYGILVVVQITFDAQFKPYQDEFDLVDLVVSSVLTVELGMRFFAFGFVPLYSFWNCFDAVVVLGTLGLSVWSFTSTNTNSSAFTAILRMRPLLRIFRIIVVFERIKQRSAMLKHAHRGSALQSPIEIVLATLYELRYHPAIKPSVQTEIDYSIYAIKNNKLYDAGEHMLKGQNIDKDTDAWLRGGLLRKDDGSAAVTPSPAETDVGATDARPARAGIPLKKENSGITDDLFPLTEAARAHFNELMTTVNDWDFDVYRIQELTKGNALTHMGYHLLRDVAQETLLVDSHTTAVFLIEIQKGYVAANPYHNAMHAADVMQTANYFTTRVAIAPFLRPIDRTLVLIAASIHDYRHDGFNNGFHIASGSELAIRYNDTAVLENFHVAQAFLTMKGAQCMMFGKLSVDDYKYARDMVIQLVLGTDMAKHFEDVSLFKTNIMPQTLEDHLEIKTVGDKKLLMKMIIHTSDVSNPAKARATMLRWTDRVVEEFFSQGDKEKSLGLVVSPFMDRATLALKKMQVSFADFVVSPLFHVWSNISEQVRDDGYAILLENREWWNQRDDNFKHAQIKSVVKELLQDAGIASGVLTRKFSTGSLRGGQLMPVREGDGGGGNVNVSQGESESGSNKLELVVKESKPEGGTAAAGPAPSDS